MTVSNGFRDRLKTLRQEADLSQEEASVLAGLGKQAFWRYESTDMVPRATTIRAIADTFGVEAKWLLTGIEPKKPEESVQEPEEDSAQLVMTVESKPDCEERKPNGYSIVYSAEDSRKLTDVNRCITTLRFISGISNEDKRTLHRLLSEMRTDLESRVLFGNRAEKYY